MNKETIHQRMNETGKHFQGNARQYWSVFEQVIDLHLRGRQFSAYQIFYKLFCENVDELKRSSIKQGTEFYRMRVGMGPYDEYKTKEDVFHIPFEKSYLVGNERYSSSGCPSLYLGSSSYVCWEELRRPNLDYANIALFFTTKPISVIDLNIAKSAKHNPTTFSDCLSVACSFPVFHPEGKNRPEYIIPLMLMTSLIEYYSEHPELGILGLKYKSTHVKDSQLWIGTRSRKNDGRFDNFVFPPLDRTSEGISKQLDEAFELRSCISFKQFQHMYRLYEADGKADKYSQSDFGRIEYLLKNVIPAPGMLTYETPAGALTR
jgi:hypothetical protein